MDGERTDVIGEYAAPINSIRDAVIGIGAMFYLLGLAVWSVHALNEGIVIRSVINLQYFVGGFLPGVSVCLAIAVFRYGRKMSALVRSIIICACLASFIPLLYIAEQQDADYYVSLFGSEVSAIWYLGYLTIATLPAFALMVITVPPTMGQEAQESMWPLISIDSLALLLHMLVIFPLVVGVYALAIYPKVPQTLGGARPRCAVVNIEEKKVKSLFYQTDRDLFPSSVEGLVTLSLIVLYVSDDVIYVRPRHRPPLRSAFTYEISRDAFESIGWCHDRLWDIVDGQNSKKIPSQEG